jgi:hypothetical protein
LVKETTRRISTAAAGKSPACTYVKETNMTYEVYNHNGTLLGVFTTMADAVREQNYYMEQTGNYAYVEERKP